MHGQRLRRRLAAAGLAVCMTIAGVVVGASAPAQAVPAPFLQEGTSLTNSNSTKSAVATCPTGTKVYGASGFLVDGNGNVTMERILPDAGLTQVSVVANEIGSFSGNWRVVAQAICGSPVANLKRHFTDSALNSNAAKSINVPCPTGTKLYGMGGVIIGGPGQIFLDELFPFPDLGSATVTAVEIDNGAFPSNWSLSAYAICGSPAATMVLKEPAQPPPLDSNSPKDSTATCPNGTKVHGVGGSIVAASGNVVIDDLQLTAALRSSTAKAYENGSTTQSWQVKSYVICAS